MTTIIAEAGVNHEGSSKRLFTLFDGAFKAGADVFKIQYYKKGLQGKDRVLPWLEPEVLIELKRCCFEHKMMLLVTPHDKWALDFIVYDLDLRVIKIGSGGWHLVDEVMRRNRGIIVSTGMHTELEIDAMRIQLTGYEYDSVLMHCVSQYPTPIRHAQLSFLQRLLQNPSPPSIGYSDHTAGFGASMLAAMLGVSVIEKHLVLEENLPDRQDTFCGLSPERFTVFVNCNHECIAARGSVEEDRRRYLTPGEQATLAWIKSRDEQAKETPQPSDKYRPNPKS